MHIKLTSLSPYAKRQIIGWLLLALVLVTIAGISQVAYARSAARHTSQVSPLHPTFALLDSDGVSVLESGKPLSTMKTCGSCHDT